MSKNIYTPYTYCITFLPTKQQYYGAKYAKNCNPKDFWRTYFTSSKYIHELIEEYGKNSFTYYVDKTFKTAKEALDYEYNFLIKHNAAKDTSWLNKHNSDKKFYCAGKLSEKQRNKLYKKRTGKNNHFYGRKHTVETKRKMSVKYIAIHEDYPMNKIIIDNITNWCVKHNVKINQAYNISNLNNCEYGNKTKGWRIKKFNDPDLPSEDDKRTKFYHVIHDSDPFNKIIIRNLRKWCDINDININRARSISSPHRKTEYGKKTKGWLIQRISYPFTTSTT